MSNVDFQSAVSQIFNLRDGKNSWRFWNFEQFAEWNSAIQQIGNLRYATV